MRTFTRSPVGKHHNIKYTAVNNVNNHVKNSTDFPVEEVNSQRPSFSETEVIR